MHARVLSSSSMQDAVFYTYVAVLPMFNKGVVVKSEGRTATAAQLER